MGELFLVLMICLKHSKQVLLMLAPYSVAAALSMLYQKGDFQWLSSMDALMLLPSMSPRFELATMGSREGVKTEKMEVV